jgi:hypothetical protein
MSDEKRPTSSGPSLRTRSRVAPAPQKEDKSPQTARSSLEFPKSAPEKEKGTPTRPRKPRGAILKRIVASKNSLKERNRDLDQTEGAQPSRSSPSKFARQGTTLSAATSASYLSKGRLLINRYKREIGLPIDYDDFDAREFVTWLLSLKPGVAASTWRVYRQAAYYTIQGKPDDDIDAALEMLDNDIIEGDEPRTAPKDEPPLRRTSAQKEKRLPKEDLDKYLAYLQYKSRSHLAPILADWLVAGCWTGLRPNEWKATSLESFEDPETGERHVWLLVMNSKTTNNRGNGLVRTIDLSDVPVQILARIKRMSDQGLAWHEDGRFATMQSQISQVLYKMGEDIFPRRKRHYCLYSCRHQFIANMKSVMKPEEVSALSGHGVTKTAKQNYGKKAAAWAPEDIGSHAKPIQEEVATVKQSKDFYNERMDRLRQAGLIHGNSQS